MSITVYTYNDKVLKNADTDKWLKKYVDPYNPLGLPSGVFRIKVTPDTSSWLGAQTVTLVTGTTDVYDVQFTESNTTQWNKVMALEVLGANTTGWTNGFASMFEGCTSLTSVSLFDTSSATNMYSMFSSCRNLTAIPLFDTSNVTTMSSMLSNCQSLTSIPLFDTSNVTTMNSMLDGCTGISTIPDFNVSSVTSVPSVFQGCINVETGALNMYNKFVALGGQITNKGSTLLYGNSYPFTNCGRDTVTGAAELAQIPSSWGGTAT